MKQIGCNIVGARATTELPQYWPSFIHYLLGDHSVACGISGESGLTGSNIHIGQEVRSGGYNGGLAGGLGTGLTG